MNCFTLRVVAVDPSLLSPSFAGTCFSSGPLGADGASRRPQSLFWFILRDVLHERSEDEKCWIARSGENRSEYLNMAWNGREYLWMVLNSTFWGHAGRYWQNLLQEVQSDRFGTVERFGVWSPRWAKLASEGSF